MIEIEPDGDPRNHGAPFERRRTRAPKH
jgi:hypothetical protein